MSNAKLAAFAAALLMAVATNASAQSAQAALKAPPHMTRARLIAWCKAHPTATAYCKEVRADTKEVRVNLLNLLSREGKDAAPLP